MDRSWQDAYPVRMARVNITVPDELVRRARSARINISRLTASALEAELERLTRVAALRAYLTELEAELGPVPQEEQEAANVWAEAVLAGSSDASGTGRRPA